MTPLRTAALVLLPVLGLAACIEPPPPAVPPAAPVDCKAADYKGLIGQPKSVLTTMLLPAGTRIIGPEDAVTADYSPERVNIEIGTAGRIEKVSCY